MSEDSKSKLIVVDISSFIFRAFYAIRLLHAPDGTPVNAVNGVMSMLLKLLSNYRPTHVVLAKDIKGDTFRNELYDQYKANRSAPPDDLIPQFALIQKLIEKMELPHIEVINYEADDVIGSICVQWKDKFDEIYIASGDKDLMQFVGSNIFMLDTMKDFIYKRDDVFAKMGVWPEQIVDYLSMLGDASDNIPGMRGIGAKGAAKLLAEHETLEKCIEMKDTFKGKKLTEAFSLHLEDGLLSKKLVQIVTDLDLGMEPEFSKFSFYPTDDLIDYLKSLGFRTSLKKVEEIKYQHHLAEESSIDVTSSSPKKEIIINKLENTDQLGELISSNESVSMFCLFDSKDIIEKKLIGISLSFDNEQSFLLEAKSFDLDKCLIALFDSSLFIQTFNAKDIFHYLLERGIDRERSFFDINQIHYILDGNANHSLERISINYADIHLIELKKETPTFADLEVDDQNKFLAERSSVINIVSKRFSELLEKENLAKFYNEIDGPLIRILSKMEHAGISINESFFEELYSDFSAQLAGISKEIEAHIPKDKCEGILELPINLKSPKQIGTLFFDVLDLPVIKKTKTGYSTDIEVLETLKEKDISPIPALLIRFRELEKLNSTYVKVMPTLVCEKTNRLHTTLNQNVALTGRLSSTNPNLQNIPVRTENGRKIRKGFVTKDAETVLISADYSQVELRLLAHFSDDKSMIDAFNNGIDIHRRTASEVLGIDVDKIDSTQRSQAKAVNFGLMYGQSSFGLAKQLGISRKEAKEYITMYFNRFSSIKGFLDGLKEKAEETGYSETLHGRKRYLPDISSTNRMLKAQAERMAINAPIQGTAADIIKIAMINIDKILKEKDLKSKMLLQVHDELIFEVVESEISIIKDLIKSEMESVCKLKVPLTVDMGMGVNWYDLK